MFLIHARIAVKNVGPMNASEIENTTESDSKAEDKYYAWIEIVDSNDEGDEKQFEEQAYNDLNEGSIEADTSLWCNKNATSSTDFSINCSALNSNSPVHDNEYAHTTNQFHLGEFCLLNSVLYYKILNRFFSQKLC